jgi:hypothetical protein
VLDLSYQYSIGQIELATDIIFKRSAPLKALFQRAVELGVLLGGADRTTQLFGRRINRRYQGKLQTVLDRRDEGHPVLRSYCWRRDYLHREWQDCVRTVRRGSVEIGGKAQVA